jgi:hypothetical protein
MKKFLPFLLLIVSEACEVPEPTGLTEYKIRYEVSSAGENAYIEYAGNIGGIRKMETITNARLPWQHKMTLNDVHSPGFSLFLYARSNDDSNQNIACTIFIDDEIAAEAQDTGFATATAELP